MQISLSMENEAGNISLQKKIKNWVKRIIDPLLFYRN